MGGQGPVPHEVKESPQGLLLGGAPTSISSVMPVRWMISGLKMRPGATKVLKVSVTSPFFSTAAPISMMTSRRLSRPVVSMSKQTISWEKSWQGWPWTTTRSSTSLRK